MRKRWICILMTLCMVFGLFPATKAPAQAATTVYVGGSMVSTGGTTYWVADGSGGITQVGASESNYVVKYQPGSPNPSLTLKGASINKANEIENNKYGIYADGELNILLIGGNTIAGAASSADSYGVYSSYGISVNGTGSLTTTGGAAVNSYGMAAANYILHFGGTVNATGGEASMKSYGLKYSTYSVTQGTLTAKASSTTGAQAMSTVFTSPVGFNVTASMNLSGSPTVAYDSNNINNYKYLHIELDPNYVAVNEAKSIIEGGDYTLAEAAANTDAAVRTALVTKINGLLANSTTGITITAANITFDTFTEASNGWNGSFDFSVVLTKGAVTATAVKNMNTITAADHVAPTITSVQAPGAGTYKAGSILDFTVNFSEAVIVTGTPRIAITIGSATAYADYQSGSSTATALKFRYTVGAVEVDNDGIEVGAMTLNSGTIRDASGNSATLSFTSLDTTLINVDGEIPTIISALVPGAPQNGGAYRYGDNLDFTVNFSEVVNVNLANGTPRIAITVGSTTAYANYLSGSGSATLQFQYTVGAGELDSDGIAVGAMSANNGTIKDGAGNDANLTYTWPATPQIKVDGVVPIVTSVSAPGAGTYNIGSNLDFTVTFSKAVSVNDTAGKPRIAITVGTAIVYAIYQSGNDTTDLKFRYTVASGNLDTDGITVGAMDTNGGSIKDTAGNHAVLSFTSPNTGLINVDGVAPIINSVQAPEEGTYKAGSKLDFIVNFSEAVEVTTTDGIPRIAISVSGAKAYAYYMGGSGSTALVFRYTVTTGQLDSDGIAVGVMDTNGGTMKDAVGNHAVLSFTPPDTTGIKVDDVAPTITSVKAPDNNTYILGSNLDFTVDFSEEVTINTTGSTPRLAISVSDATVYANYQSGSGSSTLVFRYTVGAGELDSDGITVGAMDTNGGSIKDEAGNTTVNSFTPPVTTGILVDGEIPTITSVIAPDNDTYKLGSNLDFTVNFSEAVTVNTTDNTPRIEITVGSTTAYANYLSGSGKKALEFRYTVTAGQVDSDGITVGAMDTNGGTIKDTAGNDAELSFTAPNTTGIHVDGVVPTVTSVQAPYPDTYKAGSDLDFTVTFSKAVTVTTTHEAPRIAISISGAAAYANYQSGSGSTTLVFRYTVKAGQMDSDGITVGAMDTNGGMIKDEAGNDAVLSFTPPDTNGTLVDAVVPTIISVQPPHQGTYKKDTHLDFTVNFSEPVNVNTTGATPRLAISVSGTTVYANYQSGSGSSTLVFRYSVGAGELDSDGITVGAMDMNGGTIKDGADNDAFPSFTPPDTTGIKVDGELPTIITVEAPNPRAYREGEVLEFTVIYSEKITVTGESSVLSFRLGEATKNASYTSSSGQAISYQYTVLAGDNGNISPSLSLILNGTTIQDAAGNITGTADIEGNTTGISLDTIAPEAVTGITLSDHDTTIGIDGRDFTVAFTDLENESDVAAYKIYLYKDGDAPANITAMHALAASSRVALKSITRTSGKNGVPAKLDSSVTTDSKGQALNSGAYRVIVCAVDNAGNDSFAIAGESALIMKDVENSPSGDGSGAGTPVKKTGKIEKDQKRDENAPVARLKDNSEDLKSKVLSAAEQAEVAAGKDAKVILKIEDISASVSDEDKKQIEEKLATELQNTADTALLYIDISLYKKIGDGEETRITETTGKISISIEVPESMWSTESGVDRTYRVIRVHNGVAELLTGTYDQITHLFTFETDRFSTYALTYQDGNKIPAEYNGESLEQLTVDQDFHHLRLTAKSAKTSQKLSYAKVSGADGYFIYGAQCGQKLKKLVEVEGTVRSYTVKKLELATYYKYKVEAYKIIDGKKVILATSKLIHTVTEDKIYANPIKVTSDTASVKLAVGESKALNCKVELPKGRTYKKHTAALRYETSDKALVSISSKGKLTAIAKGTCYVYVYAQNGVYKKIKVTVK